VPGELRSARLDATAGVWSVEPSSLGTITGGTAAAASANGHIAVVTTAGFLARGVIAFIRTPAGTSSVQRSVTSPDLASLKVAVADNGAIAVGGEAVPTGVNNSSTNDELANSPSGAVVLPGGPFLTLQALDKTRSW
jgi:hypothetical protein